MKFINAKKIPKNHLKAVVFLFLILFASCSSRQSPEYLLTIHPRILMLKGEEKAIKKSVKKNTEWKKMHEAILSESKSFIDLPPVERNMKGFRLLHISREALRRIFYLSYAYRMTEEEIYSERAEKEMLAVAGFENWNPDHFLDVGEMTMAMAIGYDWLYNELSPKSREIIREAIKEKGLDASLDPESPYTWFYEVTHNWNQVCNAGITYGALAVYEDYPQISGKLIERAIKTVPLAMEDYNPDGAYPEGYGYWNYGTTFNVMFLSAIDKVWPDRFDYSRYSAFLETGRFIQHMLTPTEKAFNWSDCGPGGGLSEAMFWVAKKNENPSLLWHEKSFLDTENYSKYTGRRLLPALMIWGKDINFEEITEPEEKIYMAQGPNPVFLARTSWSNPDALFIGFKAGSPSVNHGHMDAGSFIVEYGGFRWAVDLGSQDYHSLESKGMRIFGKTQDAERWTIYRMNNFSHNTLTVNNKLQRVDGYAKIDKHSDNPEFSFAIAEITSLYGNDLTSAVRGAGIVDQQYFIIRDELSTGKKPAEVRWQMMASAEVEITGTNTAILNNNGKQLFLQVEEPENVNIITWSSQPDTDYDAPNPGTILVGFETDIPAREKKSLQVKLIPGNYKGNTSFNKQLNEW
jgi:hypothetical protein